MGWTPFVAANREGREGVRVYNDVITVNGITRLDVIVSSARTVLATWTSLREDFRELLFCIWDLLTRFCIVVGVMRIFYDITTHFKVTKKELCSLVIQHYCVGTVSIILSLCRKEPKRQHLFILCVLAQVLMDFNLTSI